MNQFSIDQTRQNDKRSIREIVLKIITPQNFNGVFLWFINGRGNNGENSFFKKNEGRKT